MEQKLAVDFLVELLPQIDWDDPYFRGIWQEAKEIEKKQHKGTWDNAAIDSTYGNKYKSFEQYYNETYNK